jgi:hypothetical protein
MPQTASRIAAIERRTEGHTQRRERALRGQFGDGGNFVSIPGSQRFSC